jgi:peptidoglycan hydrolase-like protein with peptidoglycan-binding domain
MELTSELFKNNKKLQNCLNRDADHIVANEPPLRRGVNDQGDHVALIHRALRQVIPNPSFGLEEATETYGPKTAEVVRQFKAMQNPPILNKALRQTVPDNIVGKQTIAALDEQVGRKKPPPPPVAPPVKPEATEQRLVAKKTFEEKFIDRPPADLSPDSGGIGFAIGTALNQGVKDVLRMQKNPIEGSDFDDGVVRSRETRVVPSAHVMKTVDIDEEVRQLPSLVTFGAKNLRFNITRTYRYSYGVGLSTEPVRVSTTRTIIPLLASRSVVRDTRTTRQPSSLLDPR